MEPLVTVNILSYNRKDDLRNTLTKMYEQDYKNIEVIVVDNNSTDGTREMVRREFPAVHLIELDKNIGIAGWNEGFKAAKGEYVLVLDDDSYPKKKTIAQGVEILQKDKNVGVVALSIRNITLNEHETRKFKLNSITFIGCGAILRKSMLDLVGYYDDLYFLYHNELDLSIRCLHFGYTIRYLPTAIIIHNQSKYSRGEDTNHPLISRSRYYHYFISYSIFIFKYFDLPRAIYFELKWIANRFLVAVFYPYKTLFVKALLQVLFLLPQIFRNKIKIDSRIVKQYYIFFHLIDARYFPKLSSLVTKFRR